MVKKLSHEQRRHVQQAIHEAENQTRAHIALVTVPASDGYMSIFMLYGLILGSVASFGLWAAKLVGPYPTLLAIQLACVIVMSLPWLRHYGIFLAPKRMKHRRAAHRAFEEYLFASRHVGHETPFVLLYVSLAERYAHILPSREMRMKISDEKWSEVIAAFTGSVKAKGLEPACLEAVNHMAALLAKAFPAP